MMKRLIALALAALMLAVLLTSCSGGGDAISETVDEASRFTASLNLWIIAEDGMDAEQAAKVNDAINKITKRKFRTQLNIKYLPESEYYAAVEKAFVDYAAALSEARKNGTSLSSISTSEETEMNLEYGTIELKYPEAHKDQVDILFIGNADKYREYVDKKWLVSVDSLLENSAMELSTYVSDTLLTAAKYGGMIYGVPNNNAIGSYTFLAVDEALANEYLFKPEDFNSSLYHANTPEFLQMIYARFLAGTDAEPIHPLYSVDGKVGLNMIHYWSFDVDSAEGTCAQVPTLFSIYGGMFAAGAVQGTGIARTNLLTDSLYGKMMEQKVYYENTADFITTDPNARSAMRVVTGGWEEKAKLEAAGYKVLTAEAPRATDEDVYSSMFAIGAYTSEETRAMEIITYLNTNAEFRNLLQYGIEDVNYTLETVTGPDGNEHVYAAPTPENKYKMDVAKTGNMFIAYPNDPANVMKWEYGKEQNLDAGTYPTLGLYFNLNDYKLDVTSVRVLNAVSAKVKSEIFDQWTAKAEVTAFYTETKSRESDALQLATYVLDQIGTPVTYAQNGANIAVTPEALARAMTGMAQTTAIAGADSLQSAGFLYQDWLTNSGVND